MDDRKPDDSSAENDSAPEPVAGQGDELDRGSGLGASGGGLGKTTGFWSEKPAKADLKEAGANPDFDAELEKGKHGEN